jgi:hypothetical protein
MQPLVETDSPEETYFPVSCTKLVVLSFCTLGIYEIYWAWRCWEFIRDRDETRFNPFWRSVYISHLFFNFLLFWDVFRSTGQSKPRALGMSFSLGLTFAALWIWGFLFADSPLWSITLLGFFVPVPIQRQINAFNRAKHPGHDPNRSFSRGNLVVVAIGGLALLLALVGSLLSSV